MVAQQFYQIELTIVEYSSPLECDLSGGTEIFNVSCPDGDCRYQAANKLLIHHCAMRCTKVLSLFIYFWRSAVKSIVQ